MSQAPVTLLRRRRRFLGGTAFVSGRGHLAHWMTEGATDSSGRRSVGVSPVLRPDDGRCEGNREHHNIEVCTSRLMTHNAHTTRALHEMMSDTHIDTTYHRNAGHMRKIQAQNKQEQHILDTTTRMRVALWSLLDSLPWPPSPICHGDMASSHVVT